MIDYSVILGIRARIVQASADQAILREACSGVSIPNEVIDQWHGVLFPAEPMKRWLIGAALGKDWMDKNNVIVQLEDSPSEYQFLGNAMSEDSETSEESMISDQVVVIHTITNSPETCRAVYQLVKWSMLSLTPTLLGLGAHNVLFRGGGDLAAKMDMYPEYGGMYARIQRWAMSVEMSLSRAVEAKPVRVYANDVPWSDEVPETGGMDPSL